ncbi:unnamed protein product [Amaranthus hypochondriacus]
MEQEQESYQILTTKLYEAAMKGHVASLLNILQQDPYILDRSIINKTGPFFHSPLHVSVNQGHSDFTQKLLEQKPELTEEIDEIKRWSPLHVASAKGYLEIVKVLVGVNPNMCFARDLEGRNPVHVAAINGYVDVVEVLVMVKPLAGLERTNGGESVLHLCVKFGQFEAVEILVRRIGDGLLNFKDGDGNTVLHLAVAAKHIQIIKLLLKDKRMEKNAINTNGLTAMDIILQSRTNEEKDKEIILCLKHAKVLTAKKILKPKKNSRDWLEKQRSALMVVSSLIATMAFEAGINPPGGVWQDDGNGYKAGTSIMSQVKEGQKGYIVYDAFLISNTIGLISSLTVIILLISGLPCLRLFMGVLMITMWIAVTATTVTYMISVFYLVSSKDEPVIPSKHHSVQNTIIASSVAWLFLLGILVLLHVLRIMVKMIKKIIRVMVKKVRGLLRRTTTYAMV